MDAPPATPGYGLQVPPGTIQVVATGVSPSGTTRYVQAVLHIPPCAYALACSGPLSLNSVTIGGVNPAATSPELLTDPANMGTGTIVSNGSLSMANSYVKGDAQAARSIQLTNTTVVGEIRPNAGQAALPNVDLALRDPRGKPGVRDLTSSFSESSLTGLARCSAPVLTVPQDLTLDNSILYCTGDLVVQGGLKGQGMVVVLGNATINGSLTLDDSNNAVLLCNKSVTITGGAVFQGLVLCKGSFTARQIQLIGSFILNSTDPTVTMNIDNATMLH